VDDHPDLLQGLKRVFRPMRDQWDMAFAPGGEEALEQVKQECFDVIVTDMRMPSIDGAALLQQVRAICPFTVRIALSGQAKEDTVLRALTSAHQYMSKPCDAEILKTTINKACKVRDLLGEHWMKERISMLNTVPSLPENYSALISELASPDCSIERVMEIVSKDIGMTAKVLHAVNSAFFGSGTPVYSQREALKTLGLDTMRAFIAQGDIFVKSEIDPTLLSLAKLTEHSVSVANRAREFLGVDGHSESMKDGAYTAGLLHEIGRILLAVSSPDKYAEVKFLVLQTKTHLYKAEQEIFGATHAQIGAYLLALWGLPDSIVDTVAEYRDAEKCGTADNALLTALHLANGADNQLGSAAKWE